MDRISSIIPKVLRKRGLFGHAQSATVTHIAREWLESKLPNVAPMVVVKKYKDGELLLACEHPIAAQECQQVVPSLIEHLKKHSPNVRVEKISIIRG